MAAFYLNFGGVDEAVERQDALGASAVDVYPFSLAFNFKVPPAGPISGLVYTSRKAASNKHFGIIIRDTGKLTIQARNTTTFLSPDTVLSYNDDIWYRGIAIFASAIDRRLYIDGALVSSDVNSVLLPSGTLDTITAAARSSSAAVNIQLVGALDDVAAYDIALDAVAIAALDKVTRAGTIEPANLRLYWDFDDGVGAVATDKSGNSLDGTLLNMEEADWIAGGVPEPTPPIPPTPEIEGVVGRSSFVRRRRWRGIA